MAAEATRLLSRGLESVGLKAAAPPPPPTALEACAAKWCPELSWSLRLQIFAVLLVCAAVMFLLAYFIGLPLLLLRPDKFAFAFTSGSVCLMLGVALLDATCNTAAALGERLVLAVLGRLHERVRRLGVYVSLVVALELEQRLRGAVVSL